MNSKIPVRNHGLILGMGIGLSLAAIMAGAGQAVVQRVEGDADTLQTGKVRGARRLALPTAPADDETPERKPQRPARSGLRDIMDARTEAIMRKWAAAYENASALQYTTAVTYPAKNAREKPHRVSMKFLGKKPNFIRVEVQTPEPQDDGVMVSDGRTIWEYCPARKIYATTPVPEGPFLMQGELHGLRYVPASILFHPDPFTSIIGNARSIQLHREDKINGEKCFVVSRQQGRSVSLTWLSARDYLPRRTLRFEPRNGRPVEVYREERTEVAVDTEIPAERFQFRPPRGWKRHIFPQPEDALLAPGTTAPDFMGVDVENRTRQFASLRGKTVLLLFWSVFCPTCRAEMEVMNKLQEEFAQRGVVILAVNGTDYPDAVKDYLAEKPDTKVKLWRDPLERWEKTSPYLTYGVRGIPTTYLINAEGKVVKAWFGYEDQKSDELREALMELVTREETDSAKKR